MSFFAAAIFLVGLGLLGGGSRIGLRDIKNSTKNCFNLVGLMLISLALRDIKNSTKNCFNLVGLMLISLALSFSMSNKMSLSEKDINDFSEFLKKEIEK